jgi:hypothetical protein
MMVNVEIIKAETMIVMKVIVVKVEMVKVIVKTEMVILTTIFLKV